MPCCVEGFLDIEKHSNRRHIIVEIQVDVIRLPHTLKCRYMNC
jgi:hypothetical protein